jgi:hypothetical protein
LDKFAVSVCRTTRVKSRTSSHLWVNPPEQSEVLPRVQALPFTHGPPVRRVRSCDGAETGSTSGGRPSRSCAFAWEPARASVCNAPPNILISPGMHERAEWATAARTSRASIAEVVAAVREARKGMVEAL